MKKQEAKDLTAAVEMMKENWDYMIELQELMAKGRRAKYLAQLAAGFTEAEALELCKGAELY